MNSYSADSRNKFIRFTPAISIASGIIILSWYGRIIQNVLRSLLELDGLLALVVGSSLAFSLAALRIFELRHSASSLALFTFPIGAWLLRNNPEEGIHLMEYGSFALSLAWALPLNTPERKKLAISILGGTALGVLDEVLQGINPQRVFDLRDIAFNFLGVASASVALSVRRDIDESKDGLHSS